MYELTPDGEPVLVKWSGHGLGHLLNPTDPSWGGGHQPYSDDGARESGTWQSWVADLSPLQQMLLRLLGVPEAAYAQLATGNQ